MKLLAICGILPIPNLRQENDYAFFTYDRYLEKYPDNEIEFILPVPYSNYLLSKLNNRYNRRYKLKHIDSYKDRGYKITIFTFLIYLLNLNQYTWTHQTLYYQNRKKVKRFKGFDLIHAHRIFPEGYLAMKMSEELSIPYVLTVRNEERYFNGSKAEKRSINILDGASEINTPTAHSYNLLKSRYPDIKLIPHGVEKKFFINRSDSTNKTRVKILTVARLLELKNIEFVVSTLSRLKHKYEFKYIIVGTGPHEDAIKECIGEYEMQDYIEMRLHVPYENIQNIYAEADIFVLTSLREAFGRVYFEAMAAGIPIICSKNTGVDGIFEDGISGFNVNPNDASELEDILKQLIEDKELRRSIGQSGKDIVREYTWPTIINMYHKIFSEAVECKNSKFCI